MADCWQGGLASSTPKVADGAVSQQLSRTPKSKCGRVPSRIGLKGNLLHGEEREDSTPSYVLMEAITARAVLMKRQSQQAEIAQFEKEKRGGKRRRCSQALNGGFRYEERFGTWAKAQGYDEENHFTPASVSPDWAAAVQFVNETLVVGCRRTLLACG